MPTPRPPWPNVPPQPPARSGQPLLVKIVVTALAVLVGWVVGNSAMSWLRREPGVANDLLTRHWVSGQIGQSSVMLDTPWPLQGVALPFPKEFSGKVDQWTWLGHDADGVHVMTGRVVFARTVRPDLAGAADGMVKNVTATPGTASVTTKRWEGTLLGSPAIEVAMTIQRQKGDPLLMHGVVVLVRKLELVQLHSIARADQPLGTQAWLRMRDSMRIE
jgi:hypothetical protein